HHFLSKKNGEEIWDKFLEKFKKTPNIIRRTIPTPFSPSGNLEIDAPAEGQREMERENIPKRRRSVRKIKTTEPSVPMKKIPSSATALREPISIFDDDSSP
ncbi:hypothetical protein KI387_016589, partial [Taxus chinensis]